MKWLPGLFTPSRQFAAEYRREANAMQRLLPVNRPVDHFPYAEFSLLIRRRALDVLHCVDWDNRVLLAKFEAELTQYRVNGR